MTTELGPRRHPNRYKPATLPLVDDDQAACRNENPDLWYPDLSQGRRTRRALEAQAKAICHRCPIEEACLKHAIDSDQRYGVWGGMTEDERTQLTGRKPW